jgi:putative ABC transport system ATP-binding protein
MIRLVEIRKVFNAGRPNEFAAIQGVSLTLEDRKATVLKGPSGSGKTTLLSLIGCMARPTEGRIWLGDREITSLPERFLTEIRRKTFGFVFQQPNLIKGLSALDNVLLPTLPLGEPYGAIRKKGLRLFEMLGIASKAQDKVEWLSGGEAQRVTIARALINDPEVIIADEPTAHLDTARSREFMDILGRLKEEGKTLILSSHDPLVYESAVVDRVVQVRDGRIESEAE